MMLYAYMITYLCDYIGTGFNFWDVDRVHGFLGVLLERHLITGVFNRNSSDAMGRPLSGNEICMCLCGYVFMWSELKLSNVLGRE